MDTKKIIYLTILSLMLLSILVFRQDIDKLSGVQSWVGFVVFFVVLLVMTVYAVKHRMKKMKKSELKKIQKLDNRVLILLVVIIIYCITTIIFAAIGMITITIWMIFLLFTALGVYTIYLSKKAISEGRIYSAFGYYDEKKNYRAFRIVTRIYIVFGIIEIGFGIFVFTALL